MTTIEIKAAMFDLLEERGRIDFEARQRIEEINRKINALHAELNKGTSS